MQLVFSECYFDDDNDGSFYVKRKNEVSFFFSGICLLDFYYFFDLWSLYYFFYEDYLVQRFGIDGIFGEVEGGVGLGWFGWDL